MRIVAPALALALVVAACGDDDSHQQADADSDTATRHGARTRPHRDCRAHCHVAGHHADQPRAHQPPTNTRADHYHTPVPAT